MPDANPSHLDLQAIAKQVMQSHGFNPDFPPQVPQQLAELKAHPPQIAAAAQRFAALPDVARRAWLAAHLGALRAGQLPLARLP